MRFSVVLPYIVIKRHRIYSMFFLSNNFFPKSQKGNEIWTFLKMSRNWKPKIVLKMGQKCDCDEDAHNYFFCEKNL